MEHLASDPSGRESQICVRQKPARVRVLYADATLPIGGLYAAGAMPRARTVASKLRHALGALDRPAREVRIPAHRERSFRSNVNSDSDR